MRKVLWLAALALTLCGCAARYEGYDDAVEMKAALGKNITIQGVDVSGVSLEEAKKRLEGALADQGPELGYTLLCGDEELTLNARELGVEYDLEQPLLNGANLPRWGLSARDIQCGLAVDKETLRARLAEHTAAFDEAPISAAAKLDKTTHEFQYVEGTPGRKTQVEPLAQTIYELLGKGQSAAIEVSQSTLAPERELEEVKADTQLLSEFTTSFSGSTYGKKNRVFNIKKAAGLIDGLTLQPGEELDMNAALGPRNGENGWKKATGIRDATYVEEYGGGVCQVSTTLYNAALLADLKITERVHHSWPLGYVDIGRDATISTGGPNFKFVNDMETPVILCAFVEEKQKKVTVRLYGRKAEGAGSIKLRSKKVESLPDPGDEIQMDASLPSGTRVEGRESRAGSIAKTYKEYYDAAGKLMDTVLVSTDKYRPVKGLIYLSRDLYYQSSRASTGIWGNN